MKIQVKLIGHIIRQAGFSEKELEILSPITANELLELLRIEKNLPKVITRNGSGITSEATIEDGDRVVIAPLYSGG